MDKLSHDLNTALDETAGSTNSSAMSTAPRRKVCNLLLADQNISVDRSNSEDNVLLLSRDRGASRVQVSESDLEVSTPGGKGVHTAGSSRRSRVRLEYRGRKHRSQRGESDDSNNENVSPFKEYRSACNIKRKRKKLKRMPVDHSPERRKPKISSRKSSRSGKYAPSKATKRKRVQNKSGQEAWRGVLGILTGFKRERTGMGGTTPGKRMRSAREKSVESGGVPSSGSSRTGSLGDIDSVRAGGGAYGDDMVTDEVCNSSSLSSSGREDLNSDRGPEGDDEESDWLEPEPGVSRFIKESIREYLSPIYPANGQ